MEKYFIDDSEAFSELKSLLFEDKEEYSISNNKILTKSYEFELSPKYSFFIKELEYSDNLIFGKDKTLEVVAIEVVEDRILLFKKNGSVEERPMQYWLLSKTPITRDFKKLQGDNLYKYIVFFSSFQAFASHASMWKNQGYDIDVNWNPREQAMLYYGITLFKGMKPKDLKVMSFDIESDGLTQHKDSEIYLITNTYWNGSETLKKHFRLDYYNSQAEMLEDWIKHVQESNPDVLEGWNIYGYDLGYIEHVCKLHGVSLDLGRDCSPMKVKTKSSDYRVDGSNKWEYKKAHIFGRHIIDGMFLAVKYGVTKQYPSWKLKEIGEIEGIIAPDRQFYDAAKIKANWPNLEEREKIINYGIADSDEALALYDLMITPYFYTCQSLPIPFEEMLQGATGKWMNSMLVRGYLQDKHSIPKADIIEPKSIKGGMSYGIPGNYRNVLKWDASSYYPSTILAFNIYNRKKDPKGYYYLITKKFTESRLSDKKKFKETGDKYFDDLQSSKKVGVNSLYGLVGTNGLNFNSPEDAILITQCARKGLQKSIIWATGRTAKDWWPEYKGEQDFEDFQYIDKQSKVGFNEMSRHNWNLVNLDTDSLSFNKKDGSEYSEQEIKQIKKELNEIMYCNWEEDGVFSKVLIAKAKNYCLLPKGESEFKTKGSSLLDKKKESALLEMLHEILDSLVFDKNQEIEIYEKYVKEASNIKDISRWAAKKSVTKKLLTSERKNETKVTDIIDLTQVREGDKIFTYNKIDGEIQARDKNGPFFYKKTGLPKMIPNRVLDLAENFNGSYDLEHYLSRVYSTVSILENVLDMSKFLDYSKNCKIAKG